MNNNNIKELIVELTTLYGKFINSQMLLKEYNNFFYVLDELSKINEDILEIVTELKNRILNTGVDRIKTLENFYYFHKIPRMNKEENLVDSYLHGSFTRTVSMIQIIYNNNLKENNN